MNILIISDMPPCREYTAGLVEETLCNFLINNKINFSLLIVQSDGIKAQIPRNIRDKAGKIVFFRKNSEQCNGLGAISKNLQLTFNEYYSSIVLPRKAEKEFSGTTFDLIWGIIQGQTLVNFVQSFSQKLNIKYNIQLWDPIEWWMLENKFPPLFKKRLHQQFSKLLSHSHYCLSASPKMSEVLAREFGCNTTELMPSLPQLSNINLKIKNKRNSPSNFKIIFSGQKYARKELIKFLETIDSLNWIFEGKKICFNIYSNSVDEEIFDRFPLVRQFCWIDQNDLHKQIFASDLAYCPYPFDKNMSLVSELSFPGKLVSYLYCMTPVFFHGPKNSSITSFAKDNNFNYICESQEIPSIKEVLIAALTSTTRNKEQEMLSISKVFNSKLSLECMNRNILRSLA